jgi:hypothetical protein
VKGTGGRGKRTELGEDDSVSETVRELRNRRGLMGSRETESSELRPPELEVLVGELGVEEGLEVLKGRFVVRKLVGRVLRVFGELEGRVLADGSLGGRELSSDHVEERRFSGSGQDEEKTRRIRTRYFRCKGRDGGSPVVSNDGDTRVHVDTEREVLVEVVDLLSRVGEGDVGEGDDGRGELGDVLKLERENLGLGDFLDETSSLHLVDDLKAGQAKEGRRAARRKRRKAKRTFCLDLACLTKLA